MDHIYFKLAKKDITLTDYFDQFKWLANYIVSLAIPSYNIQNIPSDQNVAAPQHMYICFVFATLPDKTSTYLSKETIMQL